MRRVITVMFLILIVLLSHCNRADNNPGIKTIVLHEKPALAGITFIKEISTEFDDLSYPFLFLNDDRVCVEGYNAEKGAHNKAVCFYTRQLKLIEKKFMDIGQGPGDLYGASIFFPTGDQVLVSDHQLRRISVFDKNLEFINLIRTDKAFVSINISDDGNYILYSNQRARSSLKEGNTYDFYITTFPDLKKTNYYSLGPYFPYVLTPKPGKLIIGGEPNFHYFIKAQKIYFLNMATYEIITFDLSGDMLRRVRVNVDEIRVPPGKKAEWLKDHIGVNTRVKDRLLLADIVQPASWMVPLQNGFVVVRRRTYKTGCQTTYEGDYFDYDLKLKGKVQIPCFKSILDLDDTIFPNSIHYHDGYIYLIKECDENFTLEKWRIEGE